MSVKCEFAIYNVLIEQYRALKGNASTILFDKNKRSNEYFSLLLLPILFAP